MAQVLFETAFQANADTPQELAEHYPFIESSHESITVKAGVLKKAGRGEGVQMSPGEENVTDIVYKIAVTCDANRYNVGLGCYVGPTADERCSRSNRFCFHPGMSGGSCRIEGPGGCYNTQMDFTPPAEEAGLGGCMFSVMLNKGGAHKLTVTSPEGVEFVKEWTNLHLWPEHATKSPAFGIYDGDIGGSGAVFYSNFSISSASALASIVTMHPTLVNDSTWKLNFTDIGGKEMLAVEATKDMAVKEIVAPLQEPGRRLEVILADGTRVEWWAPGLSLGELFKSLEA